MCYNCITNKIMYTCIVLFTIPIQELASQGLVLELLKTTHKERDGLISEI